MLFALLAGDAHWVVRLLLRLGGTATVVEPAEVAESVRNQANAALALYTA